MKSTNTSTPAIVGALAITAILSISTFVFISSTPKNQSVSKSTNSQPVSTTAPVATTQPTSTATNTTTYKDGSYSTAASYSVPHGKNSITVDLTVKNDIITAVKTNHNYSDGESGYFVDAFDSSIMSKVTGKSLAGLSLSRVGGASLTTYGFQNALTNIANQAKA